MSNLYYGLPPKVLAKNMHVDLVRDKVEMCFYQYLPIKMAGALENFHIPVQLNWIRQFIQYLEFDPHTDFIYVSVKHLFVTPNNMGNRPGWHSDGFGSDDVNYIWSDKFPTQFCLQEFTLTEDHTESLKELQRQALNKNIVDYGENAFVRIDRWNIHRPPVEGTGFRTFLKFSVSKNRYNLQGNSHNYLMDYDWKMIPRAAERNHPTADTKGKVDGEYSVELPHSGVKLQLRAPSLEEIRQIPAERSAAPEKVGKATFDDAEIAVRELVKLNWKLKLKMPCSSQPVFIEFKEFLRKFVELGAVTMPVRHFHKPLRDFASDEQVSVEYILRELVHLEYGIEMANRAQATPAVIKQLIDTGLFGSTKAFTVEWDGDMSLDTVTQQKVYTRQVKSLTYSDLVKKLDDSTKAKVMEVDDGSECAIP